jgi:hypothetical protein
VTLAEIIRSLPSHDQASPAWQEPTIYAAEPWGSETEALVQLSLPKGGLPNEAAARRLVRFFEVRAALRVLGDRLDKLNRENRTAELCDILIEHVIAANESGRPYQW